MLCNGIDLEDRQLPDGIAGSYPAAEEMQRLYLRLEKQGTI